MMEITPLAIPDVLHLRIKQFSDSRGFFSETYNKRTLSDAGIKIEFHQDNQSFSRLAGTLRGLHFQSRPFAQAKLVRVVSGRILDVAVDIRAESPSFRKHVAIELGCNPYEQLFIPEGFAHGFCTLEPNTEVLYKVSNYYSPQHDFGILWNDPSLGIKWPYSAETMTLSEKDLKQPLLQDLESFF